MTRIEIYTKDWCSYCRAAKTLLDQRGIEYEETDVTKDEEQEALMLARSSRRSVPQIFIDGVHLGGFDELVALDRQAKLTRGADF